LRNGIQTAYGMVDFRLDAGDVDMQINIACLSNVILVALGGKF
jgi:hypothetical protein